MQFFRFFFLDIFHISAVSLQMRSLKIIDSVYCVLFLLRFASVVLIIVQMALVMGLTFLNALEFFCFFSNLILLLKWFRYVVSLR